MEPSTLLNPQLLFTSRPSSSLPSSFPSLFTLHSQSLSLPSLCLSPNQILIQNLYLSVDPAMRIWMVGSRNYIPPAKLDAVFPCQSVGRVVKSSEPEFAEGEVVLVLGRAVGTQKYGVVGKEMLQKIKNSKIEPRHYLGPFGINGLTAYFGLMEVGRIKEGEIVVVSSAAGAVGEIVVQLARGRGCRVVGIAGGKEKCEYVRGLGAEECVDYREMEGDVGRLEERLRGVCGRVDVYFDNVGGWVLDGVLNVLAVRGRVVCCGAISTYGGSGVGSGGVSGEKGSMGGEKSSSGGQESKDVKEDHKKEEKDSQEKDVKEIKDAKDNNDNKDNKDAKDSKDEKDKKDSKDNKDSQESKNTKESKGDSAIRNYSQLIMGRGRMEGFVYYDYKEKFGSALAELEELYEKGNLRFREDVTEGLESFPLQLEKLFEGRNQGKTLVKLV